MNCFLTKIYPKFINDLKVLQKLKSINILRHFSENSNQRTISFNDKQTNVKQISVKSKPNICVTFVRNDGKRLTGFGKEGDSLLDVVVNNDIDLDGFGACEGTLACSTCHLIFKKQDFDKIADKPTDEELDMLDLAYDLTETSRLGCQVILGQHFDGLEVKVPDSINDARAD